jgi:hypothetical protein
VSDAGIKDDRLKSGAELTLIVAICQRFVVRMAIGSVLVVAFRSL